MGLFDKFKKDKNKIGGAIGYYELTEWWLSNFSDSERDYIVKTVSPMGSSGESLIIGKIDYISQSTSRFLFDLAGWFKKEADRTIAFRFLEKAEELLSENSNIFDIHFFYQRKIETYYKHREIEPEALEIAIDACEKQIEIAPKAKKAFLETYKDSPMPSHVGFKQLAIIKEKEKKYEEAINLCKEALKQGWSGDWEKRIERYSKKINRE